MKKYRALHNYSKIETLEIVKETEKQVIFLNNIGREEREGELTEWHSWHDTFEEAKDEMAKRVNDEIGKLKTQLSYQGEKLEAIQKLKQHD